MKKLISIKDLLSGRAQSRPHKDLSTALEVTKVLFFLVSVYLFTSCQPEIKGDPERFKTGIFEAPAVEGSVSKTIITRNDSIQMEKYTKYTEISTDSGAFVREEERVDIYNIKWKNSFFYTLQMRNPKTDLDKDPIFVQITKVKENSYDFTAKIGYSKFKQNGTVTKVN